MGTFFLPLDVDISPTLFHTGKPIAGEAVCGCREASRTSVGIVLEVFLVGVNGAKGARTRAR